MQSSLNRNIHLYPWYQAATSFSPWIPVFFLFFTETVTLGEAIRLGSIYYFGVFILEIPSGYLSDRAGRRPTLLLAALLTCCAYIAFLSAGSFATLAAAQFFLAAGIAFQSGSDSSLLYDSLSQKQQSQQYSSYEAKALQFGMTGLACSCLVGGLLGVIDLRLPYVAALAGGLTALYLSWCFHEPDRIDGSTADSFFRQLISCIGHLRSTVLIWIFLFYVFGYSLEHIPFEFYQPYIALLDTTSITSWFKSTNAPLVSGIVIGMSMFGGAIGARVSIGLQKKFGVTIVLLCSILFQCIIIGGLALWLHPIFLILVMFRNFSMSMAHGPMMGVIAPRIPSAQRATYLSMQSLAGRLLFSVVLFNLSSATAGIPLDWQTLSGILRTCFVFGIIALALLAVLARMNNGEQATAGR
ncbi:hypothetical protein AB833_12715 [Chromatiales bacterium (ex Bugula neritina AB1)]|nr:hypothetical protein AB833_12715 [Chromatiales bacterium (ex Bugula neritina AB1)]